MTKNINKIKLALISVLFGTIGVISVFIPLSSAAAAFYRSFAAAIFLFFYTIATKNYIRIEAVKKDILLLIIVGLSLCVNWIAQFESFRVASVAVGTVCYNTMPIFVLILAPIMFKEKMTLKNKICILAAMIGIVFVSNVLVNGIRADETIGCIYGIIGAIGYAFVVMFNRKIDNASSLEKTTIEFFIAAIMIIPYIVFIQKGSFNFYENISTFERVRGLILLLVLSIVHTGIAYVIYFDTQKKVDSTTIAIMTYIDPVVALCLSHIVLKESLNILQIIGTILILGSTIVNEFVHEKN